MTWPESTIAVALLVLIFFIILVNFWGVFDLVFDQIRCQYIATKYFKSLYNEGTLSSEEQSALAAELGTRGVMVQGISVEEADEWGDPVSLEITGTIALATKQMNGNSEAQTIPFRFERHSLASSLRGN